MCNEIIQLTGSKSKLINKPSPEDDPTRRQPNIYLAEKALKWEATIELKEGLDLTIDYFNNL